jgi:hypothetical protein
LTTVALVTCFDPPGFAQFGRRMLMSAAEHLPPNVITIRAYHNACEPAWTHPRVTYVDNYAIPNGVKAFLDIHGKDPKKWGNDPRARDGKQNFRWACNRFAHKQFAFYHASQTVEADLLLWVDADVVFFDDVPEGFFDEVHPEEAYIAMLYRGEKYHGETGWWSVRTAHTFHREFLWRYVAFLAEGTFERETEWHDAHLQTVLVRKMVAEGKITMHNLSPGFEGGGHPWLVSPLARYADHLKGVRKQVGSSFREDLKVTRSEPYWQKVPGMRKT